MALIDEVLASRKKVVTDGYEMSIGELINLYRDGELIIDPAFQRLFRWDDERKSRFIESILLGIPVPSIFVHQVESGAWELVDGLQRVSTILQFTGDLNAVKSKSLEQLVLNGTKLLPSLDGKKWKPSSAKSKDGLDTSLQMDVKRSRIRVEIIKSESDKSAKFELFQRLNTGGVELTEQEVRNSIAISLNKEFSDWINLCSNNESFVRTTRQTDRAAKAQSGVELVLRFFAFLNVTYKNGLDVHEYLDSAMMSLALNEKLDMKKHGEIFSQTFGLLDKALGDKTFQKHGAKGFSGMFLMSAFEVVSVGVAKNIQAYLGLQEKNRDKTLEERVKSIWTNPTFVKNSGAGVRGTTRLANLLPIAANLMKP